MFREFKNLDKIFIYILHLISVEENGTVCVCVCVCVYGFFECLVVFIV